MSKISAATEKSVPAKEDIKKTAPMAHTIENTVKSDDHGSFRVHVQLLGQEWAQRH